MKKISKTLLGSTSLERLKLNILFENLTEEDFTNIVQELKEEQFKPGEIIIEDNSDGEVLYILVEGRVKIVKLARNGEEKLLALLHPGDFFGELELIDGRPRSARVVALDECKTFTLPKSYFEYLLQNNHPFSLKLLQVLSIRLRATNLQFVRQLEKFKEVMHNELRKLEQVIDAAKKVNSTLNLNKLLEIILETALSTVGADRGTLYLIDEDKKELWSKTIKGSEIIEIRLPIGKGIAGYVAATGDTLRIEDAYMDPRFTAEFDKKSGYRTKTILCMPMRNKDNKIIGVFQLLNKYKGMFTQEDERFIDALSVHASLAIENARLYEQEKSLLRIREELNLAAKIQLELLPTELPQIEGYDIAGRTIPAQTVGGDYFDFIEIDSSHLGICIGDVSGKGLPASLLMANLQATLRSLSLSNYSAVDCVTRANKLLYQSISDEKFVTLFYSILDTKNHQLRYCNAGHDKPFLISHHRKIQRLETGGLVLGAFVEFPYCEEVIELPVGSTVLFYSDGVTEAMNREGVQFGEKRLEKILKKYHKLGASELIDVILENVRLHADGCPQSDDLTLVVVKRNSVKN